MYQFSRIRHFTPFTHPRLWGTWLTRSVVTLDLAYIDDMYVCRWPFEIVAGNNFKWVKLLAGSSYFGNDECRSGCRWRVINKSGPLYPFRYLKPWIYKRWKCRKFSVLKSNGVWNVKLILGFNGKDLILRLVLDNLPQFTSGGRTKIRMFFLPCGTICFGTALLNCKHQFISSIFVADNNFLIDPDYQFTKMLSCKM